MTKVCICQICNCGRHRCPHKAPAPSRANGPCTLSEYNNVYIKHPIEPTRSFKPQQEPHHGDGPMQDDTTHRVDYIPHPLEKPFVHQGDKYVPPEGAVDTLTTHKRDYTPKATERAKLAKKEYTRRSPGKFDGNPTYKNDYRKWSLPRTEKISHDPGYVPPADKFEGDPTYTTDYVKHPHAVRSSMRPEETARQSNQPFDNRTGYRDEYIKHALPPKEAKEKAVYKPNSAVLDGLTNYKKEYTPKDIQKQPTCKPDVGAYQSEAPFDSDTTHKVDYLAWPTERPFQHKPDAYQQPDGNFDHNTTTHTDFTKKPLNRVQMKKPDASRKTPGKFDSTTNYGVDYRKWTPGERPKMTMKSEYAPPDAPFQGFTNYHDDYIKHQQAPRESMRPMENAKMSKTPFDDRTGYRDEYIKHPLAARKNKEKQKWEPNPAQMDGLSNYRKDFTPKDGEKMSSCKPDAGAYQSEAPFDSDTTHKVDYLAWPTERPFQHKPDAYQQPDGNFDHNTTTHTDFTKKPLNRVQMKKPDASRKTPGKFDSTTNYGVDYRKWTPGERPKMTMKSEYAPPDAPFQGTTNYHDEYIKHYQMPPSSKKPADQGYASNAPFESGTEYRHEYIKKHVAECPAIDVNRHGYVFKEQDNAGHKWYNHVSTSVVELPTQARINSANMSKQMTALSVA